ncbi:MAG: RNA methyltransferase [Bacilli bacterium]|nr:RNA methyltransferase [Bacilli bacterium]
MIESVNNPKIKEYSKLQSKKYRDESGLFIVEGDHLVEEALKKTQAVEIYSLDDSYTQVSESVMRKLSSLSTPPNVLAVCKKLEEGELKGNVLILENLQDPGNLGTIIRSSVAFNIDTIILSKDCVDFYNVKVLRASEGMVFNINIVIRDLNETILELKDKGYTVYTTNVVNGTNLSEVTVPEKYAIVMGNEGNGVTEETASLCDEAIYIPMNKTCESLNVGIATSIILYEFSQK